MQRKQLIRALVGRRTQARRAALTARLLSRRDRARGRLEVIDWLLEQLGARKMPPRGIRPRHTLDTRKAG